LSSRLSLRPPLVELDDARPALAVTQPHEGLAAPLHLSTLLELRGRRRVGVIGETLKRSST
jgi:hypothetical protein